MQQPDTDIPGVWRCQVEPKSDLYGARTGKLMDPEKVVKGRLTELTHMNDHHVYDRIDEGDIPKGTMIESSRWCDDLKPRDGDETNVRSRIVVQQYNVVKQDDVHQGTPPLKVLRMLLALATSKDSLRRKVCRIWDVSVAFFHSPMDEHTVVPPPPGLRVNGKLWVLNMALYGPRMASRCFGKLVAEVLTDARFETVSIVPNTYHHPQRDIDTVVHGDGFVAVAEDGQLELRASSREFNGNQASREDRAWSLKHRKSAQACRQLEWGWLDLQGGSEVDGEAYQHAELEGRKGSDDHWRQGHRER